MSSEPTPLLSRRNGRPVACVPCRARKVACDHHRPICHRCRRRGQKSLCRYPEVTAVQAAHESDSDSPVCSPVGEQRQSYSRTNAQHGYLGYTSFSNVFEETESRLPSLFGSPSQFGRGTPSTDNSERKISFRDLPVPLRETSLMLLRCLPGQRNEQFRFVNDGAQPTGWAYAAVDRIMQTLQLTFGDTLSQGEAGLRTMTEILCTNTRRRLQDDLDDPNEWIGQFCGANLRWESIGLLWAHLARVSDVLDNWRAKRLEWLDGKEAQETACICLERSIQMARDFTDGNILLLELLRQNTTLISVVDGDVAFSTVAAHSVGVVMLTYLGIHAIDQTPDYKPTLCSEYKRRIFAQMYNSDKLGTAFFGRPPLIHRQYCSAPLPLDLPDDALISDETTLAEMVAALDDQGWNKEGKIHPATVVRARCMLAYIYDSLFEIVLARDGKDRSSDLLDLRAQAHLVRASFPKSLLYAPEDASDPTIDTQTLYVRILVQMWYLKSIFLAERLLHRRGADLEGDLVATSFELVRVALKMWVYKDRFYNTFMIRNMDWLLMAYGAPAGGILCQELLFPTFSGTHPKHSEFTRSSMVQQLSLLVGFLDWIPKTAPNCQQCVDAKTTIQRILDHHLNAPSGQNLPENIDWGLMAQPNFTFDLLNTFEWMPPEAQ